jgi:hypothetical protein
MSLFGALFNRKPKLYSLSLGILDGMVKVNAEPQKYQELLKAELTLINQTLEMQFMLGLERAAGAPYPRLYDRWAVGYILGFTDGRAADIVNAEPEWFAMVVISLCFLFGSKNGCAIAEDAIKWKLTQDEVLLAGGEAGREDAVNFGANKNTPLQLAKHFSRK